MRKILLAGIVSIGIIGLITVVALAEEPLDTRPAKIIQIKGKVQIRKAGDNKWLSAQEGQMLSQGDSIKTSSRSTVILNVNGNGETASVDISAGSQMTFDKLAIDKSSGAKYSLLNLAIGEVLIKAKKLKSESEFEIKTPTSIVGVRGTTFKVKASAE